MNRKTIFLMILVLAGITGVLYGSHEFFRRNPDMTVVEPRYKMAGVSLLAECAANEIRATQKYLGKVLEVTAEVKQVEIDDKGYYTVVLGAIKDMASIRCSMDTLHLGGLATLAKGTRVAVKGIYTGYNQDETGLLGSDVQLNRCVVNSSKP